MDFDDTPEEAAFRNEARAFLERQRRAAARRLRDVAEPLSGEREGLERAKDFQRKKAEAGLRRAALARGVRRPRRCRRSIR